jgi:hypothetical protein
MRVPHLTVALTLALVCACSADRKMPTQSAPGGRISASINLGLTGPSPLRESRAFAVNDSGTVVGDATLSGDAMKAIVWRPPTYAFAFLPDLAPQGVSVASVANAIAEDGTIGGQACDAAGSCHPVFWRGGTLHVLNGTGQVNAICPCDSHTMIGGVIVNGAEHGALWVDEVLIDVGVPAGFTNARLVSVAHGFIVGNAFNNSSTFPDFVPFRWAPTTGWTALTGGTDVRGVNSSGTAVGTRNTLWVNGSNTPTPIPDGIETTAINDSGVVAGLFQGTNPFPVPALWTQSDGWTMIGIDMFATVTAISNTGHVVGFTAHNGVNAILWR